MAWYDNPAFGSYQDEEYSDVSPSKASFGVSESKNKGDGIWCPKCRINRKYTWLDFSHKSNSGDQYKPCPIHGNVSNKHLGVIPTP